MSQPQDPSVRRILPQESQDSPAGQMNSFPFAPQQYQQREMQKNYVFVDEHNRHKRLKVMRACEGCRRRKIKCDAATTNTWPCSACIRLKLHCVKPNGYDGFADSTTYEALMTPDQFQQMPVQAQGGQSIKSDPDVFANQGFPDGHQSSFQSVPYDSAQSNLHYTTVPPNVSMLDHQYASQNAFPTPPPLQHSQPDSSPEAYSVDSYQQPDLADLLGTLKMNEVGTAPYLRNKASFRREEEPAVQDDDDYDAPPLPMPAAAGRKIRVPPELMPEESEALQYFDLYFTHVHPYIPVLDKTAFYRQWNAARESISPLILEALFAIGGRLADHPAQGQQWLAMASRHEHSFMDIPRLSTLQALLMILKAREAAPKRGYFYRSWMTIVQCVQMGKDLGLHEHYEDHEAGQPCEHDAAECHLRTRIWQTVFACEVMVGIPQGRHDLAVEMESVNFNIPSPVPGGDESDYQVSRVYTYFARLVRNVRKMSKVYARLKRRKDWGIDHEFQQLSNMGPAFQTELPADLAVSFPADGSAPWLPYSFLGNLHAYYYLTQIIFHRPVLSFLDPAANEAEWKHHMLACSNAAKSLCRLQEATVENFGLIGLSSMLRGFSFPVYAGLSCIVIHLVSIVSPDPDLNSDARDFFTRHMRLMEKVMEVWPMPDLQKQIDAVREAFSADVRKPFVLKPSFPYGSPHPSNSSSPPRGYRPRPARSGSMGQHLDANAQPVSYISHPISPPISTGPLDSKSDSPSAQSLTMMPQGTQTADMQQGINLSTQSTWNPARIFEHWNASFGPPAPQPMDSATAAPGSSMGLPTSGASDPTSFQDMQSVGLTPLSDSQHLPHQISADQFSSSVPNFVTPAMWQESVATVYENGLKRSWDFA